MLTFSAACATQPVPSQPNPLLRPPVDEQRIKLTDVLSWKHSRAVEADLDGDGVRERVVVVADVEVDARQRPLWEDGHRWAVYVARGATATLLYGAFVPNGHVEAAIGIQESDGKRPVIVMERTPQQLRVATIRYDRGKARSESEGWYHVESWLPALAD